MNTCNAPANRRSRSSNAAKAVEYLQRSSEQAIERSANAEAIAQLTAALDLLKALPDGPARARRETSFQLALGGVLMATTSPGNPEVERAYSRARELSAQINDDALLFQALAGLWFRHQVGGEVETALELAKQLLSLAQRADNPVGLRYAHSALAQSLSHGGNIVSAYILAVTRMFCGYFCVDCRYIQAALGHAEAGIVLAAEYGFMTILPIVMMQQGWALVLLGKVEEGFDQISRGMAIQPVGAGVSRYLFRHLLADVYLRAKRADDGLRVVSEGLRDLEGGKRHMDHAELYRLKGELLLLQNASAHAQAESCLREAIEIAQRQRAKSWELRATMSLARLLASQGRPDEARAMLADIYGWFTEGFDTADLKDAKALLAELGN